MYPARSQSTSEPAFRPSGLRGTRAVTLVELLTVVAVIAILAAITLNVSQGVRNRAKASQSKVEMSVIGQALEEYRRQLGDYPQTSDPAVMLQSLLGRVDPTGTALSPVKRKFIDFSKIDLTEGSGDPETDPHSLLADPWGQPFRYYYKSQTPWQNPGYVLYSSGPDELDTPGKTRESATIDFAAALPAGGWPDTSADLNADNVYAGR